MQLETMPDSLRAPLIARVQDGEVAEFRELPLSEVPEHKRSLWLPVEDERPDGASKGPLIVIEPNRVVRRWDVASISDAKRAARSRINAAAENERLKYLTPGDGQSLTYGKKLDEARLILLDAAAADDLNGAALKAAFPMIWASIPSDGATASAVAAVVQAKALQWAQIGAEIEKTRNQHLDAIDAAQTVEAVNAVVW